MKLQMFNKVQLYQMNTVVVGTGAAGFNAADQLWALGQKDIAIVTDHVGAGTPATPVLINRPIIS